MQMTGIQQSVWPSTRTLCMRGRKKRKSHVPRHFVGQISIDLNQISTYLYNAV
jgi:hypothetical protein